MKPVIRRFLAVATILTFDGKRLGSEATAFLARQLGRSAD